MQGRFLFGVLFEGTLHFDFDVQLLTLRSECTALANIAEMRLDSEKLSQADSMLIELAYLSQQLRIKGIPQENINAEFLLENLTPDDYQLAIGLLSDLRKKHITAGETQEPQPAV